MPQAPGGDCAAAAGARYELAGPQALSYRQIVEIALRSLHRRRRLVPVPIAIVRPALMTLERLAGPAASTDEVPLLQSTMLAQRGTADARGLGVAPQTMADALGAGVVDYTPSRGRNRPRLRSERPD